MKDLTNDKNLVSRWSPVCLMLSMLLPIVTSYGQLGHYVIGEVVYRTLSNDSRAYLDNCGYLKQFNNSLGTASVWPDVMKRNPKYRWTSALHYYDIDNDPPMYCGIFQPPRSNRSLNLYNEVSRALRNATLCKRSDVSCCASTFHSSLLWHLLQDIYQPLHLTGKSRGGNEIWFVKNGKKYNLHRFWDSDVLDMLMTDALGDNYTYADTIDYFEKEIRGVENDCRKHDGNNGWSDINDYIFGKAQGILNANCQLVWNTTLDDYIERSKNKVKELVIGSILTSSCVIEKLSGFA